MPSGRGHFLKKKNIILCVSHRWRHNFKPAFYLELSYEVYIHKYSLQSGEFVSVRQADGDGLRRAAVESITDTTGVQREWSQRSGLRPQVLGRRSVGIATWARPANTNTSLPRYGSERVTHTHIYLQLSKVTDPCSPRVHTNSVS